MLNAVSVLHPLCFSTPKCGMNQPRYEIAPSPRAAWAAVTAVMLYSAKAKKELVCLYMGGYLEAINEFLLVYTIFYCLSLGKRL